MSASRSKALTRVPDAVVADARRSRDGHGPASRNETCQDLDPSNAFTIKTLLAPLWQSRGGRFLLLLVLGGTAAVASWVTYRTTAKQPKDQLEQRARLIWPAVRLPGLLLVALALTLIRPPAADSAEIIPASSEVLEIEMGKGALVRLDQAAASVFIAEPEIADIQVKSPRLFYVFGLRPGETTLYAVDELDQVLLNRRITVAHNLSRLQSALAAMLPQAEIKLRSVEGSVVLSGTVATAADSETARSLASQLVGEEAIVINRLAVGAPSQINLRVMVAEVKRDVLKQLGINWTTATTLGDWTFGLVTGNVLSVANTAVNSRFSGAHTRTLSDGTTTASLFFDALETEGLLTILAEPNLTAISGETATFLAGGEFPIAVPGEDGSNTVEFRQFGVSLAFTPTVVRRDRISLRVRPEVSAIDRTTEIIICQGCTAVPGLTTRRAETTVELGSGQSFMIAGLLRNDTVHNLSKFPWLGDIPILGALFRSDSFTRNETELLIIVTPYIVRPVSTRLALPTDGYVPPNDFQRYIRNRRYVEQLPEVLPVPRDRDGATLVGPAGFVLE